MTDDGNGGSTLTVQHARVNHSGSYRCKYFNLAGSHEKYFEVRVETVDPPVSKGIVAAIVIVIIIVVVLFGLLARRIHLDRVCRLILSVFDSFLLID